MNEQEETQVNVRGSQHNHTVLYVSLGLLLGAVVLLLVVVGGMYYKGTQAQVTTQTKQQASQEQSQQLVTPVPVTTKQDLTTQQTILDNTDMTSITAGLDQNTADASQFSQ